MDSSCTRRIKGQVPVDSNPKGVQQGSVNSPALGGRSVGTLQTRRATRDKATAGTSEGGGGDLRQTRIEDFTHTGEKSEREPNVMHELGGERPDQSGPRGRDERVFDSRKYDR